MAENRTCKSQGCQLSLVPHSAARKEKVFMAQNGRTLEYVRNTRDKCTHSNSAFKKSGSQRLLFYFSD